MKDLLADSHKILNRWKNYFSQLLNVHNVSDVRQIEIQKYKFPGCDQILAQMIQAECETLLSMIHKLANSILFDKWKECIVVPIHKIGEKLNNNFVG
jgi:hypothetical protein